MVGHTNGICCFPTSVGAETNDLKQVAYWDTFDGQAIRVLEGSEEGEITTLSVSQLGSEISW